jgi:hypothetical protein
VRVESRMRVCLAFALSFRFEVTDFRAVLVRLGSACASGVLYVRSRFCLIVSVIFGVCFRGWLVLRASLSFEVTDFRAVLVRLGAACASGVSHARPFFEFDPPRLLVCELQRCGWCWCWCWCW